jgi:hypothetical protein
MKVPNFFSALTIADGKSNASIRSKGKRGMKRGMDVVSEMGLASGES